MVDLVGDIGGTHARFALCEGEPQKRPRLFDPTVLACADYPSLAAAIGSYLDGLPQARKPRRAALAIAGPVTGDRIAMTNHPWNFSLEEVRHTLGLQRLCALNDYNSVSLALPYLTSSDVMPIGDFDPAAIHMPTHAMGIIAPGTGLGIGGLLRDGGASLALSSEGGHIGFAPNDKTELEIARILLSRFGRVSNERLLSGPDCAISMKRFASFADARPPREMPGISQHVRSPEPMRSAAKRWNDFAPSLAARQATWR